MGLAQTEKGLKDPWRRYESTHEQQWRELKETIERITTTFSGRIQTAFSLGITQRNHQPTRQKIFTILSHLFLP